MYYVTYDPSLSKYIVETSDGETHSVWTYSSDAYEAATRANGGEV